MANSIMKTTDHDQSIVESEDDWDQDAGSGTEDDMFDMFTAEVNANSKADNDILSLDAYHRELEREFGEGRGNHEVLAGEVQTRWEEDEDEAAATEMPDHIEGCQDVQLQRALLASNADARNKTRTGRVAETRSALTLRMQSKVGSAGSASTFIPTRRKIGGRQQQNHTVDDVAAPSSNERTYVSTEAIDDDTELVTMHGANSDTVQDQRFPYLHTEEAMKNVSAYVNSDGGDELDAGGDVYWYTPLLDPLAIRTIDILPAKALDEPIRCRMRTISLKGSNARPRDYYQTISYAWGETDEQGTHLTHAIWVEGQKLRITGNLYAALQNIRGHLDAGRLTIYGRRAALWADAICINQIDLRERSNQVRLMEQIYANSTRVLVWLGDSSGGFDEVLASAIDERLWEKTGGADTLSKELDTALSWAVGSEWFDRRWVIPEFALQRVRSVLFGNYAVDFRPFAFLMQYAGMMHCIGPMQYANLWDGLRTRRWLLANLQRFQAAKCSVDHDILYALRGVSCGCGTAKSTCDNTRCLSWLTVDYTMSIDELFVSIACRAAKTDAIAVLACAAIRPHSKEHSTASWVPDWRLWPQPHPMHGKTGKFVDDCFVEYNESHPSASFYYNNIHIWADKHENPQSTVHIDDRGPSSILTLNTWLFDYVGWSDQMPLFEQKAPPTGDRYAAPDLDVLLDAGTRLKNRKQEVPAVTRSFTGPERFAVDLAQAFRSDVKADVLMLVPWSRIAFLLRRAEARSSELQCFTLVSCFRRPIVLGDRTFEWLCESGSGPWVVGDLSKPLHRIQIA